MTKTTHEDPSVNAKSYENMTEVMSAAQALESNFNGSADSGYVQLEDGKTVGIYYQDANGDTALNLDEAKEFLDTMFTFFICFMLVCGGVAYFIAPYLMRLLFPVFAETSSFPELISLTRILLLSPIFLGFSNLS